MRSWHSCSPHGAPAECGNAPPRIALRFMRATSSIPGLAVAERGDFLALDPRIDMEIDHADPALLEDRDALFQCRLDTGGLGHRPDADRALRFRQLGDVGSGILQAQPD